MSVKHCLHFTTAGEHYPLLQSSVYITTAAADFAGKLPALKTALDVQSVVTDGWFLSFGSGKLLKMEDCNV